MSEEYLNIAFELLIAVTLQADHSQGYSQKTREQFLSLWLFSFKVDNFNLQLLCFSILKKTQLYLSEILETNRALECHQMITDFVSFSDERKQRFINQEDVSELSSSKYDQFCKIIEQKEEDLLEQVFQLEESLLKTHPIYTQQSLD